MRRLGRLAKRFPDLPIGGVDTEGLDRRDAALARAIEDAAVRRWLTLAHLLGWATRRDFRSLEPRVQGALLAGAAQLFFLDRVPAHAAVSESVAWMKRASGAGAAGLVNAALRALTRLAPEEGADQAAPVPLDPNRRDLLPLPGGGALALRESVFPEDPLERLALVTSHPPALLDMLRDRYGAGAMRSIALHGAARPPVILNTAWASSPLPDAPALAPHATPGHHIYQGDPANLASLLEGRRDLWAQDPSSSMAATLAQGRSPAVIADLCAGRGTKTRQLAAMFPDAEIVATDVDPERRAALARVFKGDPQVRVVRPRETSEWNERVDLALLDVPCSNTGVLARRVEARYRFSDEAAEALVGVQRQILADSIPLLTARGAVLYATCSLDPRENEGQAAWMEQWHGFSRATERRILPAGAPGEDASAWRDGAYATLLTR